MKIRIAPNHDWLTERMPIRDLRVARLGCKLITIHRFVIHEFAICDWRFAICDLARKHGQSEAIRSRKREVRLTEREEARFTIGV